MRIVTVSSGATTIQALISRTDGSSYHAAPGGFGHPHPSALRYYEVRGWTGRLSTPNTAPTSAQPDAVNPHGHLALGWHVANNAPLGGALQHLQCALLWW